MESTPAATPLPSWFYQSSFIGTDGSIAGSYADAIVVELLSGGAERVSMSAAAAQLNCTPSALHHTCGGRVGFLDMVVRVFAERYANWLRAPRDGAVFALPRTEHEVHGVRVWQVLSMIAMGEARAGRPVLATVVAAADLAEQDLLAWRLKLDPADQEAANRLTARIPAVLACVRGLRAAMVAETGGLSLDSALAAVDVLAAQLTHM